MKPEINHKHFVYNIEFNDPLKIENLRYVLKILIVS